MKFSVITLFPQMFEGVVSLSILGRAQKDKHLQFEFINLRDFGAGKHKTVDGPTYGGGVGLVLRPDVLANALASIKKRPSEKRLVILTSASGKTLNQRKLHRLTKFDHLIIICGHYEGVDQRFINKYVDEEISLGDFVLTGGEIPAMAIIDGVSRLAAGVMKKEEALVYESFEYGLLEHPHFTRPDTFEGMRVPKVLTSGHHKKIHEWRRIQSIRRTTKFKPDLLKISG